MKIFETIFGSDDWRGLVAQGYRAIDVRIGKIDVFTVIYFYMVRPV
jgi:hypothetical protein